MNKIDIMIVGAQKAGTTSLLRYLGEHPECVAHPQKEFAYFLEPNNYENDFNVAFSKYFANIENVSNKKIVAKSAGLYSNENAIKKLYEHNPNCKLILILRNPVERAYSSFLMEKNYGSAKFEFSELPELIKHHQNSDESWGFSFFINYGLYADYLKLIFSFFPKEQVKIFLYRDLKQNPLSFCKQLFQEIDVDSSFVPHVEIKHNVTLKTRSTVVARAIKYMLKKDGLVRKTITQLIPVNKIYKYGELLREANKTNEKYSTMDAKVRQFLIDFYKPYNLELEKTIGQDLSDWNK